MSIKHSQNFLVKPALIVSLLEATTIGPDDVVVEIGPGKGIITQQLVRLSGELIAIEADPELFKALKEKLKTAENVDLRQEDFLKTTLPSGDYKVFSNIPFNITADIVRKLLGSTNPPLDSYLFMQKEAVNKIAGRPYAAQETLAALVEKPWFRFEVIHHFQRNDFKPAPSVDVVLLHIRQLPQPSVDHEHKKQYQDFVTYAFISKKPTLRKGLDHIFTYNQFKRLAKTLSFPLDARPTDLTFEHYLGLFNYFLTGVIEAKKQLITGAQEHLHQQQQRIEKVHRTRTDKNCRQGQ